MASNDRFRRMTQLTICFLIVINVGPWYFLWYRRVSPSSSTDTTAHSQRGTVRQNIIYEIIEIITQSPMPKKEHQPPEPTYTRSAMKLGGQRVVCRTTKRNMSIPVVDVAFVPRLIREVARDPTRKRAKQAFVAMVSNHRYVDGALVLAHTLRKYSTLIRQGVIDIVVVVNEKLNEDSIQQLSRAGFDYVKVFATLSVLSPKSYYTFTFDKLYLWYLTEYDKVVFMDADFLCVGNPDVAFDTNITRKYNVAAVGDSGGDYFQTAFLVVIPNIDVFNELLDEYKYGDFVYNQWRARDGILLRNCFKGQHQHVHSEPDGLFLNHYYGFFKPWFNKDNPPPRSEKLLPFDDMYNRWWEEYEELHYTQFVDMKTKTKYGGRAAAKANTGGGAIDPKQFMWLQRHSQFEYLRKSMKAYQIESNLTLPSLRVMVSNDTTSISCTSVCLSHGLACREDALYFSSVNSCDLTALHNLRCQRCMWETHKQSAPVFTADSNLCILGTLYDKKKLPTCDAMDRGRICPCVKHEDLGTAPTLR